MCDVQIWSNFGLSDMTLQTYLRMGAICWMVSGIGCLKVSGRKRQRIMLISDR